MTRRTLIFMTVVLLAAAMVPLAIADQAGPRARAAHPDRTADPAGLFEHAREQLNLSDAQVAQIREIFRNVREQNATYRDQLRDGREGVIDTLLADPNDTAAAQALIDRQLQAERSIRTNTMRGVSNALKVLTPAQRDELESLIEHRREHRNLRRR